MIVGVTPSRLKRNKYKKYKKEVFKSSILYKEADDLKCAEIKCKIFISYSDL